MQTVLNLIKWLLQEQSDLGLHCLTERLQNILGDNKTDDICSEWCFKG